MRRTRPSNRRQLILAAARDLISVRGYEQVAMGDIAEAVTISPSALYRHFSSKQDLLFEVLSSSVTPITVRLEEMSSPFRADWVGELVTVATEHAQSGMLWQRETMHLSESQQALVHAEIRAVGRLVAGLIRRTRPELAPEQADYLAWATLAVLLSPGWHRSGEMVSGPLLTSMVHTVVHSPAPTPAEGTRRVPLGLKPRSRREHLLAEAIRLFSERGYTRVAIEDIGAALGIAGPSVYNHFATKADILVTALNRGWSYLLMDLGDVLATAPDVEEALGGVVRSYVTLSLRHPAIIGLLLTEARQLPEESQTTLLQAQREYLAEWTALVRAVAPAVSDTEGRHRVAAAVALVNNLMRTPHVRDRFALERALPQLCLSLLVPGHSER
nr:TetR/AcrR family transcriptional regulator [Streptomyces sp. SID14478]